MYTEILWLQKKEKKIAVPKLKEIYSLFRQAQKKNVPLKLVTKMPRPYNHNFLFVFFERRILELPGYTYKVIPFDYFQISQMQHTKINYRSMNPYYSAADFRAHKYGDRFLDSRRGLERTDIILDKEDQFFFDEVLVNRRLKRAQRKIVKKQARKVVRTFLKEMTLKQANANQIDKRQLPFWFLERKARLKRERFIKRAWLFLKPKSEASIKQIRKELKSFKAKGRIKVQVKKPFKIKTNKGSRFSVLNSKIRRKYFVNSSIVNFVFKRYKRRWVDTKYDLIPSIRMSRFLSKPFADSSKLRMFTYLNSYFFPAVNYKRSVLRFYRHPYHSFFSSIVKSYHPSINLFSLLINILKVKTNQGAIIRNKRLFFYNSRPYNLFLSRFFTFFTKVLLTPRFNSFLRGIRNGHNSRLVRRLRKIYSAFKRYVFFFKSFLLVSFLEVFSKQRLCLKIAKQSLKPNRLDVLFNRNRKNVKPTIKYYFTRHYRRLLRKLKKRISRIYFNVVVKKVPSIIKFKQSEVTPGQEDIEERDYFYSKPVRAFDKADAIFYQKGVTTETKLFYAQQYLKAIPWEEAIPTIQNWNLFYFLQTAGARLLNKSVFKLYYTKAQQNKSKAIQLVKLHGQQRQALAAFFIGFLTKRGPFYTNKILPLNLHRLFLDSLKDYFSSRVHPIAIPFFFKGALRFLKRYELLRPLKIVFSSYKERRRSLQVHVLDHKNANLFTSWPGLVIKQISAVMGPTQAHKFTFLLYEKLKRAKKNFMAKILVIRHLTNFLYKYVRKHSGVFELIIKTNFKLFGHSSNMRLIDNIINTGDPNYPARVLKRKFKRLLWKRKQKFFRANRRFQQVVNRKRYLRTKVLNRIQYLNNKVIRLKQKAMAKKKAKQISIRLRNFCFNRFRLKKKKKTLSLEELFKRRKPFFIKRYGMKKFRKMAKLQVIKTKQALLSLRKKLKNKQKSLRLRNALSLLRSRLEKQFQKQASVKKKFDRKPSRELRYISAFFNYLKFLRKFVVFLLFFLLKNTKLLPMIARSFKILCRFQHIFRFYIKYTFACFFLKRLLRKKKSEEQLRLRRQRRFGFINHPFFKRRARRGFYAMNASYLITKISMVRATRHGLPLKRKKSRRL